MGWPLGTDANAGPDGLKLEGATVGAWLVNFVGSAVGWRVGWPVGIFGPMAYLVGNDEGWPLGTDAYAGPDGLKLEGATVEA